MTELEYVVGQFEVKFGPYRKKRIVLHGSREYAAALIDTFGERYCFCAVMTLEETDGPFFHGVPVIENDALALAKADLIILTERVRHEIHAYRELIRRNDTSKTEIRDMYGLDVSDVLKRAEELRVLNNRNSHYWASFIAEYSEKFEAVCVETVGLVLETGKDSLRAISAAREMIDEIKKKDIPVFFSLRKSWPEVEQINMLRTLFPGETEKRIIRRTGEDLSFRTLAERYPDGKILYLSSSSIANEFLLPEYYGITAIRFSRVYQTRLPGIQEASSSWNIRTDRENLLKRIMEHDVISFDIFDTLLVRKVLNPEDIFLLTGRELDKLGLLRLPGAAQRFARIRHDAECSLNGGKLSDIYEAVGSEYGWKKEEEKLAAAVELQQEEAFVSPRSAVVELMEEALKAGKSVVLTSDMYFSAAELRQLLNAAGITGEEEIFVSCDYGLFKHQGLFEKVRERFGAQTSILHIGDNAEADGFCENEDIDFFLIPSVKTLAEMQGWENVLSMDLTLSERMLVSLSIRELFGNPFAETERLKRYACGAIGPLMVGFILWLKDELKKADVKKVLFLARDGWLPCRIYLEAKRLFPQWELPKAVYFYTSRHAAFQLVKNDENEAAEVITRAFSQDLTGQEILEKIFGIPIKEKEESSFVPAKYLEVHSTETRNDVLLQKSFYKTYLDQLEINTMEKMAAIDLFSAGSTQRWLSHGLGLDLTGLYLGTYNLYDENDSGILYYLEGYYDAILRDFIAVEAVLSSPEPSVDHIAEGGMICFAPEQRNKEQIEKIMTIQETAFHFCLAFLRIVGAEAEPVRSRVPEAMYEAVRDSGIMRFAYDDLYSTEIRS